MLQNMPKSRLKIIVSAQQLIEVLSDPTHMPPIIQEVVYCSHLLDISSLMMRARLGLQGASKEPLRGIPVAAGRHMRFTEEGEAVESPSVDRTLLRGVLAPAGSHLRFDD